MAYSARNQPSIIFLTFLPILFLAFCANGKESHVLVIYTGGTIGMRPNSDSAAFAPAKHYLTNIIKIYPQLNDEVCQKKYVNKKHIDAYYCFPPIRRSNLDGQSNARVLYWLIEYDPLLDSSDMAFDDWKRIAIDIKNHYEDFDGFVVLHGTDTMAYTASALSFMLENLGKPVVVTGSQIPLSQTRSDGLVNMENALIVAGTMNVPEVTVVFDNKLMRGNRSKKMDNHGLDAFDSPNLPPLATLDININLKRELVFRNGVIAPFTVHTELSSNVVVLFIFPSMPIEAVSVYLAPGVKGVVLQSYGSGNVPAEKRPEIIDELKKAIDRGCLIVNVSQCVKGCVSTAYKNGEILTKIGVIPGEDMTTEAALTKLAYVLGRKDWDNDDDKTKANMMRTELMKKNLAGEMTYTANMDQIMPEATDIPTNLVKYFATNFNPNISATLMGSLVYHAAFHNDVDYIKKLHAAGVNMNAAANIEYRGMRSPLHVAAASGALKAVELLLHYGASVHARDENDETPLFVAVKARNVEIVEKIKKAGGELHLDSTKIDAEICRSVISEEIDSITAWHTAGVNLSSVMFNGETALHLAASKGILSIGKTLLDLGANPSAKNNHGRTPMDLAVENATNVGKEKRHNFEELIDLLRKKMHTGSGKFLHQG